MTKSQLTNDLKKFCGGSFITRTDLAKFMRYQSPKRVDMFLDGLDRINGTRYFIADVAERILQFRE